MSTVRPTVLRCWTLLALLAVAVSGCSTSTSGFADLAEQVAGDDADPGDDHSQYHAALAAEIAHEARRQKLKRDRALRASSPSFEKDEKRLQQVISKAQVDRAGTGAEPSDTKAEIKTPWRVARQVFYLGMSSPIDPPARFAFSRLQARRTELDLASVGGKAFRLQMACDGAVSHGPRAGIKLPVKPGVPFEIWSPEQKRTTAATTLVLSRETSRCTGTLSIAGRKRGIEIVDEEAVDPSLGAIDRRYDICRLPARANLTALERAFYSETRLSQTCPFSPGEVKFAATEDEGFNAKVAALLGQSLPETFFTGHDPEAPIDFSRAPRVDLVYLSVLEYKADFSGRVLERLMRYHAARGAVIRIMVSNVLEGAKDRALLERLAADYPNVELRFFQWHAAPGSTFAEEITTFYKVHHAKMLAVVSPEKGRSRAVVGGRNIHDGFLFPRPLDLRRWPNLQQYRKRRSLTTNYYSNWHDFDLVLSDDAAVRTLTAHLSTLWHADGETYLARPFSVARRAGPAPSLPQARHFLSVPYADGRALENYYIALFDAAESQIEIVNPYLNLTPRLGQAFRRALDRGVKVTIIGRINLKGDLGGEVLTALNQSFVNRYTDRVAIYDFLGRKTVLHSKILMIDHKLVVVSSVNLNNRSFIHDSENGMAFLDPDLYRRMKAVFEDYRASSRPVKKEKVGLIWRLMISGRLVKEAL